ncbi:peroxiredoxin-like family protein [Alteromonas lipolytica]|nr:peroxiredoxin-like family protein [Alteromonas lipolytica]GGF76928.1 alkyl hydroperoxide reductase [Alteromonas lipolytica]
MRMRQIAFTLLLGLLLPLSAMAKVLAPQANAVTPLLNGMKVPAVTLQYPDGSPVSLTALTMQQPAIILFYRGGWCPYCNRQFSELQKVEDQLIALGYQILAISPQSPDALQAQELETEMKVQQLSDYQLDALREFGVGFYVDDATAKKYAGYNIPLTKDGTGTPVLPAPGVFIVNKQGQVQFTYVNPDFTVRPSAQLILSVAEVLASEG